MHAKRLFFPFVPCGKCNVLLLFPLHLLSPLRLSMLFPACSFVFLAFSSHILTSTSRITHACLHRHLKRLRARCFGKLNVFACRGVTFCMLFTPHAYCSLYGSILPYSYSIPIPLGTYPNQEHTWYRSVC